MAETNDNARLEMFCDGVFAIALTLLIIDIKVPEAASVDTTPALWRALWHLAPSILAFGLSFGVVLITWVNHHGTFKLVRRSSASFMYANGFLLLTVVFLPFPTALVGAFIWTDHAGPAVVLYDAVLAVQAIGWLLLTHTALKSHLLNDARAVETMREQRRNSYRALGLYAGLALLEFWLPVSIAIVTVATWIFWLILSIRIKSAEAV
jgi:uncharacterized membrane protein